MQGVTQQARELGAIVEFLPQPPDSMSVLENVTVDPNTFGWSTRVGYEKYRVDGTVEFEPWHELGPIDSLYVYEQTSGGKRYTILFESEGALFLYFELGGVGTKYTLQSGRTVPAQGEPGSVYTPIAGGVVVTNGRDAPIVVRPWPLPDTTHASTAVGVGVVRNLGFSNRPAAPDMLGVETISAQTGAPATASNQVTGDSVTLWWPAQGGAISRPKEYGLGFATNSAATAGQNARFRYKVSFVLANGSESPLSSEGVVDWELPATSEGFRYCTGMRIPIGPEGTVARRIYRTQNQSTDSPTYGDLDFYFIDQLNNNVEELWFDAARSSAVGATAPLSTDSVPLPSPFPRSTAVFGDCLFIDGGDSDPLTIYYSNPGLPDQFGGSNYVRLSATGGAVVRLFAHYRVLVVLRENGVDVISGDFTSGFNAATVTSQVAIRSPNTVDQVPGLGVLFLAQDGVYALQGGFDGGSTMEVLRLSEPVKRTIRRLTPDCAGRAVARYSPKDRAYHLYFPADGNDRPNLGLVFHTEKEGWSLRTGFPVGSIDRLFNGALIFGHNTGSSPGNTDEAGLFVLSSRRAMGGTVVDDVFSESGPPTSKMRTAWIDMGDPQMQKKVQYVTFWMLTTGSFKPTTRSYKDFEYTGTDLRPYQAQPPDAADLPVYDAATVDTDSWTSPRLVPIRVGVAQQSCSAFAAEIETTDDVVLVGVEVTYKLPATTTIAGKR